MANPKKKEAAASFLQLVLDKIPEDKREGFKDMLSMDPVLDFVGDGVLRQADYTRQTQELQDLRKQHEAAITQKEALLDEWYRQNQAAIATGVKAQSDLERLQAAIGKDGTETDPVRTPPAAPPIDTSKFLNREEAQQLAAQLAQQGWQNTATLNKIAIKHFKEFGEELDVDGLADHARKTNRSLQDAWSDLNHERIEQKQKEAEARREADLRKKIESEVRASILSSQSPYPTPSNTEPSTLAGLSGDKSQFGIMAAVEEFRKIRSGAGQ